MIDQEFETLIFKKSFKSKEFNKNPKNHQQLLRYLKVMPISKDAFTIIPSLMKFYSVYILIAFADFYKKVETKVLEYIDYDAPIKRIASCVKAMLKNKVFPELQFFFMIGLAPEEYQFKEEYDENEKKFLSILERIRGVRAKMEKDVNKKTELMLKEEYFELSKIECVPKNNVFAQNYIGIMLNQVKISYKQLLKQVIQAPSMPVPRTNEIYIEHGHPIYDPIAAKSYLCCRTSFYLHEILEEPESMTIQYKNYSYPYDEIRREILLKTMVGFLNLDGGIIYLGIRERSESKLRTVQGYFYNQATKQQVLKTFRRLCQCIEPQTVNNKMYAIQFVPIKQNHQPYDFEGGRFIVKVRIMVGKDDELYCYRLGNDNYKFAFRTENEVLANRKINQKILELYRDRLTHKRVPCAPLHNGPCKHPELGQASYSNSIYRRNQKIHDQQKEDESQIMMWEQMDKKKYEKKPTGEFYERQIYQSQQRIERERVERERVERERVEREKLKEKEKKEKKKVQEKESLKTKQLHYVIKGIDQTKFCNLTQKLIFPVKTETYEQKNRFIVSIPVGFDNQFIEFCSTLVFKKDESFQMKPISTKLRFQKEDEYRFVIQMLKEQKILCVQNDKNRTFTFNNALTAIKTRKYLNPYGFLHQYVI